MGATPTLSLVFGPFLLLGLFALILITGILLLVRWAARGNTSHLPDAAALARLEAGVERMEQRVANLETILLDQSAHESETETAGTSKERRG